MISALSMHYRKEEEVRKRRAALERWKEEQIARGKDVGTKQKANSNTHLTASPARPPQQSVSEPALHKAGINLGHHSEREQSPGSAYRPGRKSPNPAPCTSAQY